MLTYTLRRLLGMIPLLLLISVVVFTLAKSMPGDALTGMIDPANVKPEYIAEMRQQLGYNDPIPQQFVRWFGNMLRGDFGQSFIHKMPVSDLFFQRLQNTAILATMAICITYAIAFLTGMIAGRRPNTPIDYSIQTVSYIVYALPSFIIGIVCIYIFAIKLGWVPASGSRSVGVADGTLAYYLNVLKNSLLPAFVLGSLGTAAYTQFLRNDIIESSRKDYVRTARAKGTSERHIYNRHILRNSLIPMVTFLGIDIGGLFGGAVITETLFVYPGMGELFVSSISSRDYSVVMTITMFASVMTLIGNLVSDLLYGYVDPRIRLR
ncbi:oligopeptide ABC transporter permease [Paenibacillus oleatilyticus]|uniref:Oligopeptide ABC transporter permease n=1 Tax=Paenibacillus oleatilyticus TaxID=2594886 RepID=A0ABV4V953_9BACL